MDSCRTCLRPAIADRGHFLFDPSVRPATDMLISNTSLKIFENDGLPNRICDDCFAKLTSFQDFCQLSISSDITYRTNHPVKDEFCDEEGVEVSVPSTNIISVDSADKCSSIKSEANWGPSDDDWDNNPTYDGDEHHPHPIDELPLRNDPHMSKDSKKNCIIPSTSQPSRRKTNQRKRPYAPRPGARSEDKSTKYTCDECGKYYYEKIRLAGHLRQHFGLRPFPCDRCPKQYDKYSTLRNHQVVHAPSPDQPTMCPHEGCGKSYRMPRHAQDHFERIHMGMRPKVSVECICDTCGKSFKTRSNLLQHIKSHMDIDQYPYQCEVCDKRFLAKYNYNLHVLRHQNLRNFPCPMCPARMVSQLEVKTHISKVHDKSVTWPCTECSAVYYRKAHLRSHVLKVHRGYKPHICSFCNRAFGTKPLLVKHERLHTGEKPFACPICDRRFAQETHMKSHVKTHNKHKDESR